MERRRKEQVESGSTDPIPPIARHELWLEARKGANDSIPEDIKEVAQRIVSYNSFALYYFIL